MNEFKEDINNIFNNLLVYKHICVSIASFMLLIVLFIIVAFPAYEQQQMQSQKEERLVKRLEALENFAAGKVERDKKLDGNKKRYEQLRQILPYKIEGYTYLAQLNLFAEKAGGILKGSNILKDNARTLAVKVDRKDKTLLSLDTLAIGISYQGSYEQILFFLELLEKNNLGSVENIRIIKSKNGNLELEGRLMVYALR